MMVSEVDFFFKLVKFSTALQVISFMSVVAYTFVIAKYHDTLFNHHTTKNIFVQTNYKLIFYY